MHSIYQILESNIKFKRLTLNVREGSRFIGSVAIGSDIGESNIQYIITLDDSKFNKPYSMYIHTDDVDIIVVRELNYSDIEGYLKAIEAILRHDCICNRQSASICISNLKYLKNQYPDTDLPKECFYDF